MNGSPVPELSFLPAPYRGWTRACETRVQDNLHAHAQSEPIKNNKVPTTPLASMCRAMPFSARAQKENIFLDVDIVVKKHKNVKIEIWFIVLCTLIDNEYASLLFSQTFFSYCLCMLSDFAKVFERKVWRVQVAHLHNAARALSSPSRCFQSTVRKKMATATFTYNALRTKTLKELIKAQRNIVSPSNSTKAMLLV